MSEEVTEAVARAIWTERVRHAKEVNGIDLEAWGQKTGFVDANGDPDVAAMNNILGEARAAIAELRRLNLLSDGERVGK